MFLLIFNTLLINLICWLAIAGRGIPFVAGLCSSDSGNSLGENMTLRGGALALELCSPRLGNVGDSQ